MPEAITYRNATHEIPGWVRGALSDQARGYAYALDETFVHFYGKDDGLWTISPGLTATEARGDQTLEEWVSQRFGATAVMAMQHPVGASVKGMWRPGLIFAVDVHQALGTSRQEQRAAEQSLHLLVSALNEVFLYIEPRGPGLATFSAKTRELLILACTEVEDGLSHHLRDADVQASGRGFTTKDYVRLLDVLRLAEYQVALIPFANLPAIRPFANWDAQRPTQSLAWYDAYNKAKHDRSTNLPLATLERCIEAVAACVVMYCVRFSPFPLYNEGTPLASLVSHLFAIELTDVDPSGFYVPLVQPPAEFRKDLVVADSTRFHVPWTISRLRL